MNEGRETLIIYDNNGRIWGVYGGVTEVPEGVQGFVCEIPDGTTEITLDMSTTPPTPHFVSHSIDADIDDIQMALIELDMRLRRIEEA